MFWTASFSWPTPGCNWSHLPLALQMIGLVFFKVNWWIWDLAAFSRIQQNIDGHLSEGRVWVNLSNWVSWLLGQSLQPAQEKNRNSNGKTVWTNTLTSESRWIIGIPCLGSIVDVPGWEIGSWVWSALAFPPLQRRGKLRICQNSQGHDHGHGTW